MGTVANLVVKITAETAQFNKGLADINSSVQGFTSTLGAIGGALAGIFAASEIAGAVEHVGELADHLEDLAKKSGLTTEAVQALDFAAKQSGSSFDNISAALAIMSKNLVGGKDGIVKALADMGLSLAVIRAMTPDQAFIAIGAAIAQIPDPMRRSADAMALFGRQGATLLPVLTSDLAGLTAHAREAGLVIGDETVAAGNRLHDKLTELHTRIQTLTADAIVPLLDVLMKLPPEMQTTASIAVSVAPTLGALGSAVSALTGLVSLATLGWIGLAAAIAAVTIPPALKGLEASNKANIDAGVMVGGEGMVIPLDMGPVGTGKRRTTDIDLPAAMKEAHAALVGLPAPTKELSLAEHRAAEELKAFNQYAAEVRATKLVQAQRTQALLGSQLQQAMALGSPQLLTPLPTSVNAGTADLVNGNVPGAPGTQRASSQIGALMQGQQLGDQLKAGMADSLNSMPQVILAAFEGGGSVFKAITSKFGGDFAGQFTGSVTKGLDKFLPTGLAKSIGGLMGPLGAILGPMITGLVAKLGGAIWHGIQGMFGTDEEARSVNPARDSDAAKYVAQFGGSNSDAVTKALEAAGLGGAQASALVTAYNSADTMAKFTAAKTAIDQALATSKTKTDDLTHANDTFNMSLTGSDDAIKQLGQTEMTVTQMMLDGFSKLIGKIDEMIAKLSMAGVLSAQVAAASIGGVAAFTTPGEFIGTAPMATNQDLGITSGTSVTINAGNIIGNPDDLAYMVIDAIEAGGDVASDYRNVHDQIVTD